MSDLQQLLEGLTSPSSEQSEAAHAQLLRRLDLPAVAAGVCRLLGHPEAKVRCNAARLARDLGPVAGAGLPQMLLLLDDPEPRVREQVCLSLAALGEGAPRRELAEAMIKAAHDPVYDVRKAAALGLHRLGPAVGTGQIVEGPNGAEPVPEWVSGLADQLLAHVTPRRSGYLFTLPVGDNRMQRVRISINPEHDTLCISTECGPLGPGQYAWALEQNLQLAQGRLALRRSSVPGRSDELVLLANLPLGAAFPAQTAELIRRLAELGDRYEMILTAGSDER
ncbi:MAG: hypothetical protein FJ125_13635 [Deltaproteobacteria bacterium]|nr:hypothetical protein [Deltaproteobacteria bacterium]